MKGCGTEVRVVGQGLLAYIGGENSSTSALSARIGPLLPGLSNHYHSCISLHQNMFGGINLWLELEGRGWRWPKQQGMRYCKNLFPKGVFTWKKTCVLGFLKTEHDHSIPPSKGGSSILLLPSFLSVFLGLWCIAGAAYILWLISTYKWIQIEGYPGIPHIQRRKRYGGRIMGEGDLGVDRGYKENKF